MTDVRVAIVGAGAIVTDVHIPAWQASTGVEIVAICDTDIRRAKSVAAAFRIPHAVEDLKHFADLPATANVVDIASPPHTHEGVAAEALRCGYHVIIEKPAALSAEGVQHLSQLARDSGLEAWTAQSYRYRDAALLADQARAAGQLGLIEQVTIRSHGGDAFRQRSGWEWREAGERLLLYELGIHYLDLAVRFAGSPTGLHGTAVRRDWAGNITTLFALVEHESRAHTIVDIRVDCSNRFVQLEVSGTNHDAVIKLYPEDIAILRGQNTPLVDLAGDFRRLSRFAGGLLGDRIGRGPVKRRAIPHYRLFSQFVASLRGDAVSLPSDLDSVVPTFRLLDLLHREAIAAPGVNGPTVAPAR